MWKNGKLKVSWKSVDGAEGYDIYAALCGDKLNASSLVKSVNGKKNSVSLAKIGKKFSQKKTYKVQIKAYRITGGQKVYIGESLVYHVAGQNDPTYTNASKVRVSDRTVTVKAGKTKQIRASVVKQSSKKKLLSKGHGPILRYYSTDPAVAS